jgi:pyrimidine operon attenuation protein/uracil phosphoribosyltransferase
MSSGLLNVASYPKAPSSARISSHSRLVALVRHELDSYDQAKNMKDAAKGLDSAPLLREKSRLMSSSEIERTLVRLAHEIVEKNNGSDDLTLVGIHRRGVPLARRLAKLLETIEKKTIDVGTLDISFYRDDLSTRGPRPVVNPGDLGFDVNGRDVVLVDDVLYTGRTVRAALDALIDHGRPKRVQLLTLIDRGHRELPIEATFVGRTVQTTDREIVEVKLEEVDGNEQVLLVERIDG